VDIVIVWFSTLSRLLTLIGDAMSDLTPKMERFAQEVASGKSQAEAYRIAYDAKNMGADTIHSKASILAKDDRIRARVDEIRMPIIKAKQLTLETHLEDLKALRNMAIKDGKLSAAINAEIARGKAAGVAIDKVEVEHNIPEIRVRYVD
jgi:phage terminase small subunit